LTTLVLVTQFPHRIRQVAGTQARALPHLVKLVVEGVRVHVAKVCRVYERMGERIPTVTGALREAQVAVDEGAQKLNKNEYAAAYLKARDAMRAYRRAMTSALEFARERATGAPAWANKYRTVYYALPEFFDELRRK